jgi:hypothetical protein
MPILSSLGGGSARGFGQGLYRSDPPLYAFTSFTFTTAATRGVYGPSLSTLQNAYSSTSWTQDTNWFNVVTNGVQRWTVPKTATYTFVAAGAEGNTPNAGTYTASAGGLGAVVTFNVSLTQGDFINIVVGQQPILHTSSTSGGGGGTFIYDNSNTLIAAVGGGGGGGRTGFEASWNYNLRHGKSAADTLLGNDGYYFNEVSPISRGGGTVAGGSAGYGGWHGDGNNRGAGGAGWNVGGQFSAIVSNSTIGNNMRGKSRTDFWTGGLDYSGAAVSTDNRYCSGGFGGGGAGGYHPYKGYGGGGGGYSGGGGSSWNTGSAPAGGGSTYVPGGYTSSTAGSNSGGGSVQVTKI